MDVVGGGRFLFRPGWRGGGTLFFPRRYSRPCPRFSPIASCAHPVITRLHSGDADFLSASRGSLPPKSLSTAVVPPGPRQKSRRSTARWVFFFSFLSSQIDATILSNVWSRTSAETNLRRSRESIWWGGGRNYSLFIYFNICFEW